MDLIIPRLELCDAVFDSDEERKGRGRWISKSEISPSNRALIKSFYSFLVPVLNAARVSPLPSPDDRRNHLGQVSGQDPSKGKFLWKRHTNVL